MRTGSTGSARTPRPSDRPGSSSRVATSGHATRLPASPSRVNAGAAIAARHDVRVGLHNHDLEMHDVEGAGPAYALIRDATDPSVDFQVDIFWVVVGGASPAAVIRDLGSRVCSLHVKDGLVPPPSASGGHRFVNSAVGSGVVDPAPAIEAAATTGSVEWLIVELDHAAGPVIDAVSGSIEYLVGRGLARSCARVSRPVTVRPARVALIGCGNVSQHYVAGCASLGRSPARRLH